MTEISESNFSNVIDLLKQQKYEEALPILNYLVEKNPTRQEYFVYHLLVLRIMVLRWNLSRKAIGPVNYSWEVVERITGRLASAARILANLTLSHLRCDGLFALRQRSGARAMRSLGQFYQSAQTSLAKLGTKNAGTAGASCALVIALLGFYINAVSSVESLAPSKKLTATYGAQSVAPVSEVKANHPATTEVARQDRQGTPLPAEADEQKFLRGVSKPSEALLPKVPTAVNDHLDEEPSHVAPSKVSESNAIAKRQELKAVRKIENPSGVATKIGSKTAKKNLGEYQSRHAIRIRESPSFAAKTVQELDSGILLSVLEFIGSWAKVELKPTGITGFVRREFLLSTTNAASKNTDGSAEVKQPADPTTLAFSKSFVGRHTRVDD